MLVLPLAGRFWSFLLVSLLIGLGNGFGAGIVMTFGADYAPPDNTEGFLSLWRLMADIGGVAGPLIIGTAAQSLALGPAALIVGVFGIAGTVFFQVFVKRT